MTIMIIKAAMIMNMIMIMTIGGGRVHREPRAAPGEPPGACQILLLLTITVIMSICMIVTGSSSTTSTTSTTSTRASTSTSSTDR